jgi:hypothetical protein
MPLGAGAGWDEEGSLCAAGAATGVGNMEGWMRGLLKGRTVAWWDWETMAGIEAN